MNAEQIQWSRRYERSLRKHLGRGSRAPLKPAVGLGRQAVRLGLATLDVAMIHEQALAGVALPGGSARTRRSEAELAKSFFAQTIVPIEKTHRAAHEADASVSRLTQALRHRTEQAHASARRLEKGIAQRQAAEAEVRKSAKRHARLLQDSGRMQNRLRYQTRDMLAKQEDERQRTSRQLHDEIAQTLLAIDVRLLSLKGSAIASSASIKKEIAETQRVVRLSVRTITRLAQKFGPRHEV